VFKEYEWIHIRLYLLEGADF